MEAASSHARVSLDLQAGIRRACEAAVLVLLCAAVAMLAWRRAAGALIDPLPGAVMLGVGLVFAMTALYLSRGAARGAQVTPRSRAVFAGVAVMGLFVAAILSIPGSSPWGLAAVWMCVVAVPVAMLIGRPKIVIRRRTDRGRQLTAPPRSNDESAELDGALDRAISQRLVRRVETDGSTVVEGLVRATFERGQRTAAAHVAFCPSLDGEVECSTEQVDGPPAEIRIAQLLPYGVRFEVKLERSAAGNESVLFEFYAGQACPAEKDEA